jgi:hypothetical protein
MIKLCLQLHSGNNILKNSQVQILCHGICISVILLYPNRMSQTQWSDGYYRTVQRDNVEVIITAYM